MGEPRLPVEKAMDGHKTPEADNEFSPCPSKTGVRVTAMVSDKAMYWMAVGVLAFGVANGLINQHAGWVDRFTDRSMMLADRASDIAIRYADRAETRLDRSHNAVTRG